MIKRREFIAGLGTAAVWPMVARAQQTAMPVVGVLLALSADDYKIENAALLQSLKEAGFVAGQNVAFDYRYAESQNDRLPALAADLVLRRVAVILAGDTRGESSDDDHTHRLLQRHRPGRSRPCRQPQPARREPNRHRQFRYRARTETVAIAPRVSDQRAAPLRLRGVRLLPLVAGKC